MMKKLLLLLMMLAIAIPLWASDHMVTIHRGEGLYQDGTGVYYCVKDGIMMTFTDGLDNSNYLQERRNTKFEVRSANYIIRKVVFHCVDNTTEDNLDCYAWGPTTISMFQNFTYPGQLGTLTVTDPYTAVWEGQTAAYQFSTAEGRPVRFGSVDIIYDKLDGDIFDLVTNRSQITADGTYILVSQYHDKVMRFKKTDDDTHPATDIVEWMNDSKTRVKVDGDACMIKMLGAKDSSYTSGGSTYTRRVARTATLNNGYIRVGTGTDQGNLLVTTTLNNYSSAIMYLGSEYNFLCWYRGDPYSNSTNTIRYDDSGHKFKIMSTSDADSRVWLYKLSQSYHVYTQCDPANGGTINLGLGVAEGTSQQGETVNFTVDPASGYCVDYVEVTYADGSTGIISVTDHGDGNYSFEMPAADVTVKAHLTEIGDYQIFTENTPVGGGVVNVAGQVTIDDNNYYADGGNNVTVTPNPNWGWEVTGVTVTDASSNDVTVSDNGDGSYSFTMPSSDVTASVNYRRVIGNIFDLVTNTNEIQSGQTYIIVSQNYNKVMRYWTPGQTTFASAPIVNWPLGTGNYNKVKVDDNAAFFRMDNVADTTVTGTSPKAAYLNTFNGFMRTRYHNVFLQDGVVPESRAWMYLGNSYNCLMRFNDTSSGSNSNWVVRYDNTSDNFSVLNWNVEEAAATRVWLYKLAESYDITTICNPDGGGSITLTEGMHYDPSTGEPKSQAGETVTFSVTPNNGYNTGAVTVTYTDGTTGTISLTNNNDGTYSFVMPDDAVTITANFAPAGIVYDITTECNPSNGGYFHVYVNNVNHFASASALSGDQVAVWVGTNPGYRIASVTAENLTTGEAVTLTLDPDNSNAAGNTYDFTMPVGNVKITAKFYTPLFLLGTAMGRTSWCPSGPEFTFDAVNDQYYLDVYFKGGNVDQQVAQDYGYFSLAGGVAPVDWTNKNENYSNRWGEVSDRLAAVPNTNNEVAGGQTGIALSGDNPDNAFKIKAGIYRIIVNHDKNQMNIVQYNPAISFNPESESPVRLNDVVDITCDLQDMVHDIASRYNINEDDQQFEVKTDGMVTWTSAAHPDADNAEAQITHIGTTNVHAEASIGYIVAKGDAEYIVPNYYDIHTVVTPEGAATITVESSEMAGETVNFTVSDPTSEFNNYTLYAVTVTNESTGEVTTLTPTSGNYSFTMPESAVTITADFRTLNNVTASWTPADGGQVTIQQGDMGTYFYNGETVTFTVSTNSGYEISSVSVTSGGSAVNYTDNGDGTYTFTMPENSSVINVVFTQPIQYFDVTTSWSPSDGGFISLDGVNTPQTVSHAAGSEVVFGVAPAEGYRMTSLRVVNQLTHEEITPTPTGTSNEYTFTMPTGDVTITAQFDNWYNVTRVIDPEGAGSITVYALSNGKKQVGSNVEFYVTSNVGYVLESVTVTNDETLEIIETTQNNYHYFFDMPAADVTITAHYVPGYYIRTQCVPAEGGTIDVATHAEGNEAVSFTVTPSAGYVLTGLTVKEEFGGSDIEYSYDDVSGTYSFTMPATSVKITAHFSAADYLITTAVDPEGSGSLSFTGATYDEFNNQYRADEGDVVKFSATPNNGWRLNRITVTGPDGEIATSTSSPYYLTMPACDVTVTAYFVRVYNITKECLPPEGGTINLTNTRAAEGDILRFSVHRNSGYAIQDVTVTYVDEDDVTHTTTLIVDAEGYYEFTMPAADVTVTARFEKLYNITTVCLPPEGGTISDIVSSATEGQSVSFSVNENSGYAVNYVTMSYMDENYETQTTTLTPLTPGNYSFIMPAASVTIRAYFGILHTITTICTPPEGGSITVDNAAAGGAPVSFTVDANPGYSVNNVTMSYEDSWYGIQSTTLTPDDNGVYHFTMPDFDVTITAEFGIKGEYQVNLVNYPPQGGSMTAEGHVRIENNNVYSDEGKTVVITPTPSADWLFDGISAQDEHGNPVTLTNNGDGTYSMVMPAANVTVTANYYQILPPDPYNIYTDYDSQKGSVTLTGDAADALAFAGETVTFTVQAKTLYGENRYAIDEVYVTIDGTEDQVPVTKLSGSDMLSYYSFTMPEGDVTVHATFKNTYKVRLEWTPAFYGADRIDVFEPGYFHGGDASNVTGWFPEGTTVEIRVKNLWENSDHGNYTIENCEAIYFIYDPVFEVVEVIAPTDQSGFENLGNNDYRIQFVMPAHDVDAYIDLRAHTTLKFIESSQYIPNGTLVEVSDELIGTWSAQNVLWAKDQVESFNKTEKEDGAHDYVRSELRLQKKAWNQNNGVQLRFDGVLESLIENEGLDPSNPDDENAVKEFKEEFYKEIEEYVDNYIKGGTIKGTFYCDGNYIDEGLEIIIDNPVDCYGHNHKAAFVISVEEMPKHRDGYDPTQPSESLGYPGYIPDPREMPKSDGGFYDDPIKYNYNHYTTANFCATNIAGRSGLYEGGNIVGPEAPDSLQNKKVFFMNPKDGEIAQVWGVYKGHVEDVTVVTMPKCFPDKAGTMSGEMFTIYKSAPGFNRHDFAGYFLVGDNNEGSPNGDWLYNRLSEDRFDYGRPSGDNQLHPGEAYLFHAAIEEIGHYEEGVRGPRRTPDAKEVPDGGLLLPFRVYPLDLYSASDNFTTVHEIRPREASEIVSIRYYNVMGQESMTPFDGINIEVIRYKDGSMISNKVLK